MIKSIGLKKLKTDVFKREPVEVKVKPKSIVQSDEEDDAKADQVKFDFNIEKVKNTYIFPFNQSFLRKNNSLLRDKSQYNVE